MKAVLTGASGGIGLALFQAMADAGFDVACCGRRESAELRQKIERLNAAGACHRMVELDLECDESIMTALKQIEAWSELRIDVLINNAGVAFGALASMTKTQDLRRVLQVNFIGALQMIQRLSRLMARNGGGRIINMASNAGIRSDRGTLAYGCSKAALIHATRILAVELAAQHIAVNAVAPSVVDTPMKDQMDKRALDRILEMTATGQLVTVDEVVRVVLFLACDAPLSLTGEILSIDGGMSA